MDVKFWSCGIFCSKLFRKISFLEIAGVLGVSERSAKRYIKKDLENGFIKKEASQYRCKKYKTLLSGRNTYRVTDRGRDNLKGFYQWSLTPQSFIKKNSSKEEFAKGISSVDFSKFKKEKVQIFAKYKLSHLASRAPHWWFRDCSSLEKTLKLLNYKRNRGYRIQNEARWISSVIQDKGRGFRYKIAKKTALVLANNRKESKKILKEASEKVLSDFDKLKELKKRGLNTSFSELEKLLRKGFSHLSTSAEVLLKILKWQRVENLNGFLNWLVSLKEPFEVVKKKPHSVSDSIEWTKAFFADKSRECIFDTQGEFEKWIQNTFSLNPEKVFVQFHIFKALEESFVRTLHWSSGGWKENRFAIDDSSFKWSLLKVFQIKKLEVQREFFDRSICGRSLNPKIC